MRLFFFRLHELHRRGEKLAGRRFLAQKCDTNDKTVAGALKLLTEGKLLAVQHIYSNKGHKITQYEFTEKMNQSLQGKQGLICDMYWETIKKLCFPKDELRSRKKGGLSRSHRYLMSVLLYHADECGAVYDLTMGSLATKAGLGVDRLRSQLRFLKNEKYLNECIIQPVRSHIFQPGAAVIFINTRHSIFAKQTKNSLLKISSEMIAVANEACAGAALYYRANALPYSKDNKFRGIMDCPYKPSRLFFKGHDYKSKTYERNRSKGNTANHNSTAHQVILNQNLPKDYLQAKLDQYASWVLTNYRCELPIHRSLDDLPGYKEIERKIFSDMFPNGSLDSPTDDQRALVKCCIWEVYGMAKHLHSFLNQLPALTKEHYKLAIFPPPQVNHKPRFTIEICVYPEIPNQETNIIELNDDFSEWGD
jgi:hypothetical protein